MKESLALYRLRQESQKRYEELERRRQALETQLGNLKHWTGLLSNADRLFNDLARLPDLREQLTGQVVPEIQAHLTKRKVEGLEDWEPFQDKIKAIEEELDSRRRHGNERFGEAKESYERFLRGMSISDYRLRTRYTYGEDEGSYRDLYREIHEKVEYRIREIYADLEREKTDLLKAKHIFLADDKKLVGVEKQLASAQESLEQLHRALTIPLIEKTGDELTAFGQWINDVAQSIADIRQQLGPILFANHQLTSEEEKVLDAINERNGVDLTDLFVRLRHTGREIELRGLLTTLEGLYRKNRVVIRIKRRG